ncbi:MAG: NUDIX domain-containing protein [Streptosporangiales bacterium]
MAEGDGNGWVVCAQGHRHWGKYGAAGLLAAAPGPDGQASVLLILRASWTQHPGTWGPPGGARDSYESASAAALREAAEECAVPPGAARIHGLLDDDHGGWSYQTLVADSDSPFPVWPASAEAPEVAWVPPGRGERAAAAPRVRHGLARAPGGHPAGHGPGGRGQRDGGPG